MLGAANYDLKEIALDMSYPSSNVEQTYLHELTHMILAHMGEDELTGNEKFVNLFSELLYQAIETAKY